MASIWANALQVTAVMFAQRRRPKAGRVRGKADGAAVLIATSFSADSLGTRGDGQNSSIACPRVYPEKYGITRGVATIGVRSATLRIWYTVGPLPAVANFGNLYRRRTPLK